MKRIFIAFCLVAGTFALTNCAQKEAYAPVQEETQEFVTFEFEANLPIDTKTYNDGMSTKWSADDQIKIVYVGQYTGIHEVPEAFTYAGSNRFVGKFDRAFIANVLLGNYSTLKAIYPYETNGEFQPVTVQKGFDSMAHLAGKNCPLSGEIKVSWDQDWGNFGDAYRVNDVTLEHTTSVVEVSVVNNTASAIEVSEVDFLVDGEVKATTVVEGADALAAGETAKVYVVVEPATYADSQLSFQVNDGTFKKDLKATEVTFTAGLIRQVNFVVE